MSEEVLVSDERRSELTKMCDDLRAKIANMGESAETRVRLANVHLHMGEREEAISSLQIALNLRPDTPAILAKLREVCSAEEFADLELPEKIEPFWRDIPGLFRYPLGGSGVYLLIGGTIFVTILQHIINLPTIFIYGTMVLALFLSGYLCSYFISIMRSSAKGRTTPPDWPDVTDIMGNIFGSLFIIAFPVFISFLPALLYTVGMIYYGGSWPVLAILVILGELYFPMALIASAITGAPFNSANFIGIINSIRKVKKDYFIAELVLALFSVASVASYFMVAISMQAMAGRFIASFAIQFVSLYFMMIFAHILGLLYRQCKSRIMQ